MKTITIRINKNTGEIKSNAEGFIGSSCAEATNQLLAKLGANVVVEHKPEFDATEEINVEASN